MALNPRTRDPRMTIASAYAREKRVMRNPRHTFSLRQRPYQVQPFMLAPVLPGETMKNLLLQARVVSDPLATALKLVGWWCEYWFFYVKHRDLEPAARAIATGMMLDPATDVSTLRQATVSPWKYTYAGAMDWTALCMQAVIHNFFRDEDEDWDDFSLDGVPMAQIFGKGQNSWADSLTLDDNKRTDRDYSLDDGSITARELIDKMQHWQALRDAGLVSMDYEDFLRTYGAEVRQEETSPELHKPELVRYLRDFTYPVNVVEPSTGVPSTAAAWSIAERADKDRRFNEPGFLIGLCCQRPKVYFANQKGSIAGLMDDVYSWLPAILHDNYERGFKFAAGAAGPVPAITDANGYWIDIRDLFVHGDQFINYTTASAEAGQLDLPTAAGLKRYATSTDIDQMFAAAAPLNQIRTDGVVTLGILGRQQDHTPQVSL